MVFRVTVPQKGKLLLDGYLVWVLVGAASLEMTAGRI